MTPLEKLTVRMRAVNSLVCVGLDADVKKLPARFRSDEHPQFAFNKAIIDATHPFVCAYKPNMAFYEARGTAGLADLKMTMEYLVERYSDIFTICDAKRADIGSTNQGSVEAIFDWLGFDAVTVNPYLGQEALMPFLNRTDKISIVLCRTSNPGAREFQDMLADGQPLWKHVASRVVQSWNVHDNCMLVVGATYPAEMAEIRRIAGTMTFLVPGIGQQGGDVEAAVRAGLNADGKGMIVNSSRAIIFAADPALEAQTLRDAINTFRPNP